MLEKINRWLLGVFSNSDVNKLLAVIFATCAILWLFIGELAPLLSAVLIAYVLDGAVKKLETHWKLPHSAAVIVVIILAMLTMLVAFYALPRFLLQLRELGIKLPETVAALDVVVVRVNEYLPAEIAMDKAAIAARAQEITTVTASYVFNNLFNYAGNVVSLFIYMVLFPLLVFFLLRDKAQIINYLRLFIPDSPIFAQLWREANEQFGSYIRGKMLESALVGSSTWIVFFLLDVNYSLALSILVGLSVFVPFVGAVLVTIPVVLFAFLQFGWSADFAWVIIAYTVIQTIDAQAIVPLLFAEVIKIHPVALFAALIFFGNLWGLWGIFFAIPLAALIKTVIAIIIAYRAPDPPETPESSAQSNSDSGGADA